MKTDFFPPSLLSFLHSFPSLFFLFLSLSFLLSFSLSLNSCTLPGILESAKIHSELQKRGSSTHGTLSLVREETIYLNTYPCVRVPYVTSVTSDSLRPHGQQHLRGSTPRDSPEKNAGVVANPGIESASPALAGGFFTSSATQEAPKYLPWVVLNLSQNSLTRQNAIVLPLSVDSKEIQPVHPEGNQS